MIEGAGEKKDEARKQLETPQVRGSLEQILATRKTVQRLLEIAEKPGRAAKKAGAAPKSKKTTKKAGGSRGAAKE